MQPQFANQAAKPTARQPVSADVMQYAQNLSDRAQSLAERVIEKLHPVMTSDAPRACAALCKESVEYPPMFADLRSSLQGIDAALDSIEGAMSRTEL